MFLHQGFSKRAIERANVSMILREKPVSHVSDKISDKDIERAWRTASMKVFGNGERND